MNKKSFTLIEILVALIVLSIIASVSVAFYQKTVDANNERICAENLKVLQAAIDIYTVENDALPLQLSQLTPRHIYLASCRVIEEIKENLLSIALRKMFSTEPALAVETEGQLFKRRYLNNNEKVFCDPAVRNCAPPVGCTPDSCGSSYTINYVLDSTYTEVSGKQSLKKDSNVPLISDTGPTPRHRGKFGNTLYTLGVTPGGRVGKVDSITSPIQQFL